ncbi:MAG: hypothetical protein KY476_04090, partial [Planctomycetes bacterium]|nr:hypothetical protein [Planctomycetota bacterium]
MLQKRLLQSALLGVCLAAAANQHAAAEEASAPQRTWLKATAYAIPRETAPEGEGYFSIVTGHNGRLYIGTHAN